MTVKEYAKLHDITPQAVLYRIKNNQIQAKKDKKGNWAILADEKAEFEPKEILKEEVNILLKEIEYLKQQVTDKEMIIEAERRSNIALLSTVESYKLLQIKEEPKEKKGFFARLFK